MTNIKSPKVYDLEERTAIFGSDVIKFAKNIPQNIINNSLINQLIRSSTSIGSNYCEADCAESRKDFEHKISICKKESKETKHWLKMISVANPELDMKAKELLRETTELQLIFVSIVAKSKLNRSIQELKIRNSLEIGN